MTAPSSIDPARFLHEQLAQASNIYAREPHAFDEDSRTAATRFGPYAAVAAGNLHAYQSARDMVANLQTALETRGVIDQAKAILMDRHKLTADQAFQALAQMSMKSNRKLRAVAEDLVRTGEQLPGTWSAPDADPSFTHRVASDREPRRLTSSRHGFRGSCSGHARRSKTGGRGSRPTQRRAP